eukprot:5396640-Amphidinium_carterae.2
MLRLLLVGIGGALFDFSSQQELVHFFSDEVPSIFVKRWMAEGKKQPIAQAELLAVVVAKLTWLELLRGCFTIVAVDNAAARGCLIRGSAYERHMKELLLHAALVEMQGNLHS